ncbi:hypothetical protein GY45DRAFT_1261086, partial [Cubamyces sp. BRFM 1775]
IDALIDSLPPLIHLLRQLVPLYPVLTRVVQTFDAVSRLELRRHGVDRKVRLVFLEMRNVMAILLQLRTLHVIEDDAPDGIPLRLRLYNLVVDTNRDILEGANACDAYISSLELIQVHNAQKWNEILLGYVRRFRQRQADFALIITLYSEPSNSAVDQLRAYILQPYEYVHRPFMFTSPMQHSSQLGLHTSFPRTKYAPPDGYIKLCGFRSAEWEPQFCIRFFGAPAYIFQCRTSRTTFSFMSQHTELRPFLGCR